MVAPAASPSTARVSFLGIDFNRFRRLNLSPFTKNSQACPEQPRPALGLNGRPVSRSAGGEAYTAGTGLEKKEIELTGIGRTMLSGFF